MTSRHRHSVYRTLFLLALMCLATSSLTVNLAPAVADTPTTATPPANPTIYDEVRAGKPGALEEVQLELMVEFFRSGGRAYGCHTGKVPDTVEAILEAGLLPFSPTLANGDPMPVLALQDQRLPRVDSIGVRLRSNDFALFRMGANGDPLTPLVESLDAGYYRDRKWIAPYPWKARLATHLESALISMCSVYASIEGVSPLSRKDLQARLQLAPVGCTWLESSGAEDCGVTLEVDSTGQFIRTTRYPDPGFAQVTTYAPRQWAGRSHYLYSPSKLAMGLDWVTLGTLVPTSITPNELQNWTAPPATPAEPGYTYTFLGSQFLLLKDMAWYAGWHLEQTGKEPSAEWIIGSPHFLHRMTDKTGGPLPLAVAPAALDKKLNPALFLPGEPEALVECGKHTQEDGSTYPMVRLLVRGPDSGRFEMPGQQQMRPQMTPYHRLQRPSDRQELFPTGTPVPDPVEIAKVRTWLSDRTGETTPVVREWLWIAEEIQATEFPKSYAWHAATILTSTYSGWLMEHPMHPIPESWAAVLADYGMQATGYRPLTLGEPMQADAATCELAIDTTSHFIRVTLVMPNGDSTQRFMATALQDETSIILLNDIFQPLRWDPQLTFLDYTPIATFAIPIPDPPVIPEVPAP